MSNRYSFVLFKSDHVAKGWVWWRVRGGETRLSRLDDVPWSSAASLMVHPDDSAEAWRRRTAAGPAELPPGGSNGPDTQRLKTVNQVATRKPRHG